MKKVKFTVENEVECTSVADLIYKNAFVGFQPYNENRYMLTTMTADKSLQALRPNRWWKTILPDSGNFFIFSSAAELLQWMADGK